MSTELQELFATIADEEMAAAAAHIQHRIITMADQDDAPVRARLFASSTLVSSAELGAELEGSSATAAKLRRLADRIEAQANRGRMN